MIAWLALIPAVFLAVLAMERLEEHLVPHTLIDRPDLRPHEHEGHDPPGPAG